MGDPYRESAEGPKPPIVPVCTEHGCTFPACLNCGHAHDEHYWFNSEFVDCGALGRYNESVVNGVLTRHQVMSTCKCERYRYR